jgi:anti-sigma factor RsiW
MGEVAVPVGLLASIKEAASAPESSGRWRIGFPLAAAAVLILGIGTFAIWSKLGQGMDVVRGSPLVPVTWVAATSNVHINCSKHAAHFGPQFPRALQELPNSLRDFLGHDAQCQCPDLSKLGYQFAGCGPCIIPGGKTAHLLYQPTGGGGGPVSLFVQLDRAQLAIENGKTYLARDPADGTEMIVWRGQGVVYYLVGENDGQLKSAAGEMGMKLRIR